jgi:hypothetical protein
VRHLLPRTAAGEKILTDSFQICGALGVALYGLTLLVTQHVPPSLAMIAPHWVILIWGGFLLTGGLLTLTGMFRSLALETAGLILMASATIGYGAILPFHYGVGGLAAVCFSASFGVGALIRAYSIWTAALTAEAILRDSD